MPFYDYACDACGPFISVKSMAQRNEPQSCPECGGAARREITAAPALNCMPVAARTAARVNEQSRHVPRVWKAGAKPADERKAPREPDARSSRNAPTGMKTFPAARPWMIGH